MTKLSNLIKKYAQLPFKKRTSFNNKITLISNLIWACGKITLAVFIKSVFISLSGFYTIFIALAKTAYFDGKRNRSSVYSERKYVKRIAFSLMLAGLAYLAYFAEIFTKPQETNYDLIFSITLATIAFCEVTFSIIGIIKSKKTKDLLLTSLKFINLASALSSIVLTQIALLSLELSASQSVLYNTITGMLVGFTTVIFAIFMFIIGKYKFTNSKPLIKHEIKVQKAKINLSKNKIYKGVTNEN